MAETLPPTIIQNTYTLEDAYVRIDMLQRALEHGFFKGGDMGTERSAFILSYYGGADAESQQHAHAIAAWDTTVLDSISADTLYARIQALKDAVQLSPKLVLYVPVRLLGTALERIGKWCRAEIQPDLMLDLRVDASAIGGCSFVYNNAFHDLSFTYFARKEREKLTALLQTYA